MQEHVTAIQLRTSNCEQLQQARQANAQPERPSEETLAKLDASIRKNAALAKKLRNLTDATLQSVLADVRNTNQSKFLSEAISALLDAVHKPRQVPCVIKVRPLSLAQWLARCLAVQDHESETASRNNMRWSGKSLGCSGSAVQADTLPNPCRCCKSCTVGMQQRRKICRAPLRVRSRYQWTQAAWLQCCSGAQCSSWLSMCSCTA